MGQRLIDADALYSELVKANSFGELTAKKAIRRLANAPTIDAVPVIRCKDCAYYSILGECYYLLTNFEMDNDDYCSNAKPKEDS